MAAVKLKAGLAWVLIAGVAASAAVVLVAAGAGRGEEPRLRPDLPPIASAAVAKLAPREVPAGEDEEVEVNGRVVDPDGKPFVGARLVFYRRERDEPRPAEPFPTRATSDALGRFRFRVSDPSFRFLEQQATWDHPTVAALAEGYGPAWVSFVTAELARDVTLRLVRDDVPIDGRVLDLEGRPIAGVTVTPRDIEAATGENLDTWLAVVASAKDNKDREFRGLSAILDERGWAHGRAVVTDRDGRFRLTGIGRERVVSIEFAGPTIIPSLGYVYARTPPGPHLPGVDGAGQA